MATDAIVRLNHIHKLYSKENVLQDVTLSFRRGEVTAIVGSNGSGKSTLLRIAAGLTAPSAGYRTVDGRPVIAYAPDRLPKLRFTPRDYLSHMADLERRLPGSESAKSAERIEFYLKRFGIADTGKMQMRDFSKGMLQKVNLIQALLRDPELLILDEPFGGLDEAAERRLADHLEEVKRADGAVIVASHEADWISAVADRVVTLDKGIVIKDERTATGKSKSRMIVDCLLPEESDRDAEELPEEAIHVESNGRHARYEVEAEQSDRFLLRLLESGASIVGVRQKGGIR